MLGEVLSLSDGDWIESKDQSSSGFRLIQTGNIGEGAFEAHAERARFIPTETFNRLKCTEVFPGDCLISRLPDPIGRACILPDIKTRMITAVDCAIARPVNNKIDMRFFVYYTSTSDYKGQMERGLMGSTRQRISRRNLNEVVISLPDIKIQKEIVASFTAIDTQISSVQFLLNKYEAIKNATVNLLLKQKQGWRNVKLGDVLKVCHGKCQHLVESEAGLFPILATSGEIGRANQFLYDKPSVLIGRKGTIDKPQYIETPFWTIDTLFYTKIADGYIPKFVFYLCKTIDWASLNEASGVPSLSANRIESIEVCVPQNMHEQKRIVAALDSIYNTLNGLKTQLEKSQAIKQGMMSYFFG